MIHSTWITTRSGGAAKANLFKVPKGNVIPFVFGKAEKVMIIVRNVSGLNKVACKSSYPGSEIRIPLKSKFREGYLQIEVPLIHGCVMVDIEVANNFDN